MEKIIFLASSVLRQQSSLVTRLSSSTLAMRGSDNIPTKGIPSVPAFLKTQKDLLQTAGANEQKPCHLCIGNAAGDADSVVR
jgi:hypothetical protein